MDVFLPGLARGSAGDPRRTSGGGADRGRHRPHGGAELPAAAARVADRPHSSRRAAGGPPSPRRSVPRRGRHLRADRARGPRRADPGTGLPNRGVAADPRPRDCGGNLGTAPPAGDAIPVLAVHDAEIEPAAAGGRRRSVPWALPARLQRVAREPDELIWGALASDRGPRLVLKVGTRNAMVIAVERLSPLITAPRSVRGPGRSRRPLCVPPRLRRSPLGPCRRRLVGDPAAGIGDGAAGVRAAAACRDADRRRSRLGGLRRHAVDVLARGASRGRRPARTAA